MFHQTYIITGATSGLGRAVAWALRTSHVNLVLVGRSVDRGTALVEQLRRSRSSGGIVEFVRTDLSVQDDVRALAARVRHQHQSIDCLINNAGARFDEFEETSDGIERTFATNYLGHFLLTRELTEPLRRASSPTVVTIGSSSHAAADITGGWFPARESYDRRLAYANSKLASTVFGLQLANRLAGDRVTSVVVDPGIVLTNFARNNGLVSWLRHFGAHALRREIVSPQRAARAVVGLAASPRETDASRRYFRGEQRDRPSDLAQDPRVAESLWRVSFDLTTGDPRRVAMGRITSAIQHQQWAAR